jgi:hypothetical protein
MIAATYIEDKPYLLNCFKLWQHTWGRHFERLWVCGPAHVRARVELAQNATWFDAMRVEPYDYVGGHCAALSLLPYPANSTVWLSDPDTVCLERPDYRPPHNFAALWFLSKCRIPSDPFSRDAMEKQERDAVKYFANWTRLVERLIAEQPSTLPVYFNTGVIVATGDVIRILAAFYVWAIKRLCELEASGDLVCNSWVKEQIAYSLAVYEIGIKPDLLKHTLNTHNHPAFFEGRPQLDPKIIHYGWDALGFDKKRDLSDLAAFVEQPREHGGSLVEEVRNVARDYLEEKCNAERSAASVPVLR